MHDETVVGSGLLGVPPFEFGFLFGRHTIRIVVGGVGHRSFVVLIL